MNNLKTYYLYLTIFITGAAVLAIEIAGTRILAPFYGSTIFVWSSLIIITLGFLALGYFISGRLADKHPQGKWLYAVIFLGGASALFILKISQPILILSDRFGMRFGPMVAAFLLFSLPFFLLSMAGPFVIRLRTRLLDKSGNVAGMVFGISTAGSLIGALITGFFLIPNFFISSIFIVISLIIMLVAIIGLYLEKSSWQLIFVAILLIILVLAIPLVKSKDLITHEVSIIHQEPSFYADLKVVELPYARSLVMNGISQSAFSPNKRQVLTQDILELNREIKAWPHDARVLVLGFGAGEAARILDSSYQVDYIEIDPKTVKLAKDFFDFELNENDQIIISDARRFLRTTDNTYDIIFVDIYNGGLIPFHTHTREALRLMKARLKPNGVLLSNIIARPDDLLLQSLVKTTKAVFPKVITGAYKEGLSNILIYASPNLNYEPQFIASPPRIKLFTHLYQEIEVDDSIGLVIIDDKNPIEILETERLAELLDLTKEVFGFQPLFNS